MEVFLKKCHLSTKSQSGGRRSARATRASPSPLKGERAGVRGENGMVPFGYPADRAPKTDPPLFNKMNAVANWEEIPLFDSEEAEAAFWADNRMELRLMETAVAASSEASESVTITLRIDPRMLARIKRLARSRYLNYQSMIKQWLSERMEGELRER